MKNALQTLNKKGIVSGKELGNFYKNNKQKTIEK